MATLDIYSSCLTCNAQDPRTQFLAVQNEENIGISNVLRKHFWFTEVDLQRTVICQRCWNQVNDFNRFYDSVEELHQNRLVSVIVKSEPEVEEHSNSEENLSEPTVPELQDERVKQDDDDTMEPAVWTIEKVDGNNESDTNVKMEDNDKQQSQSKKQGVPGCKSRKQRLADDAYIKEHVKFICEACGHESQSFSLLRSHAAQVHGKNKTFVRCCGKKYFHKHRLYEHVQVINNPNMYRCELCKKNLTDSEGYQYHHKAYHTDCNVKCERCLKSFTNKFLLKVHMQEHVDSEQKGISCEHCGKHYISQAKLQIHIRQWHDENPAFKCEICSMCFRQKGWYLKHKQAHDNPPLRMKLQCEFCLVWLKDRRSWYNHVRYHHVPKVHLEGEVTCEICGHVAPNPTALKVHTRRKHGKLPKVVPQNCPHCPMVCNWRGNLRMHIKRKHPVEWLKQTHSKPS